MSTPKITKEIKLQIAKEHVEQGMTFSQLKKKYRYCLTNIKYYCSLYAKHGEKAFSDDFKMKFTREIKLNAVKRVLINHESCWAIAIELGLKDPTIVRGWVKKYNESGEKALQDSASRNAYLKHNVRVLQKEHKKLLKDLEITKAENEYLKKFYSLILKRSKDGSKRK